MNQIQPLTVGPIVGHTDTNQVRIWGRAKYEPLKSGFPRRVFGVARIKKQSGGGYGSPKFFKMNPNFDLTGLFVSSNLKKETHYTYQMGWFFSDKELDEINSSDSWDWSLADQGEFQTTSDDPMKEREFIFGSCRYLLKLFGGSWFDSRGDKTFRSINEQISKVGNINKLLMIGDQIYADDLNFLSPDKQVEEFYSRYRDAFSQTNIKKLMSNVSTYMTLDDHEIENNWPIDANDRDMVIKYPAAIHAYQVYQMSHSPLLKTDSNNRLKGTPDKFYYDFTDGCCEFFVTDTRTERDTDNNEIVSEEQMADLLSWLNNKSKLVKFVVSSVPFFPDIKKANKDKWSGFKSQRDIIISHIQTHNIKNIVFLSGDVHCSMSAELDIGTDKNPLKIYSIISSAFYWPYPHMKRRNFKLKGYVSSATDKNAYELGKISEVYSSDNFTRVKVKPTGVNIEVFNRKGDLEHVDDFMF